MRAYDSYKEVVDVDCGNIFVVRLDTKKMIQFDDDEFEYGLSCDYCESYSLNNIPWVKFQIYDTLDDTRVINFMNYGGGDNACERGLHIASRFGINNGIEDMSNIQAWYRVLNKK